jgi:hypothetical protein
MKTFWARCCAVLMVAALFAGGASAQVVEREGVKFEPTAQVGGTALQLNGAGVRTRAIFKVYAAGLYVPQKSSDAAVLLAQKGPRRLSLTMLRTVDADAFAGPLNEGLHKNHTDAQVAAFKPQIDGMNAALKAIDEAKKGDVLHFDYLPDSGTRITLNGQQKGPNIPGEDFFTAMLRIWLGDKPADADLKKGLLAN